MDAKTQTYGLLVGLFVLALVIRRTLTTQTVRVWALIAVPLLIAVMAVAILAATPPASVAGVAAVAVAAIAGAALGYARGIHSKVQLGPRPGTLIVQGNVLLVVILVTAFIVRYAVRAYAGGGATGTIVSDAFIVFAAASVAVARGMLFFTWRRLTGAATGSPV